MKLTYSACLVNAVQLGYMWSKCIRVAMMMIVFHLDIWTCKKVYHNTHLGWQHSTSKTETGRLPSAWFLALRCRRHHLHLVLSWQMTLYRVCGGSLHRLAKLSDRLHVLAGQSCYPPLKENRREQEWCCYYICVSYALHSPLTYRS